LAEKNRPANGADRIAHRAVESHDREACQSALSSDLFCIRSTWNLFHVLRIARRLGIKGRNQPDLGLGLVPHVGVRGDGSLAQ
jgi:hypothetical protein